MVSNHVTPGEDRCYICGNDNPNVLESHHIVPRRFGGPDDEDNRVILCANHHMAIESIYDDSFYESLGVTELSGSLDDSEEAEYGAIDSKFGPDLIESQSQEQFERGSVRRKIRELRTIADDEEVHRVLDQLFKRKTSDNISTPKHVIADLEKEHDPGAPIEKVVDECMAHFDLETPPDASSEINKLLRKGDAYEIKDGYLRTT